MIDQDDIKTGSWNTAIKPELGFSPKQILHAFHPIGSIIKISLKQNLPHSEMEFRHTFPYTYNLM